MDRIRTTLVRDVVGVPPSGGCVGSGTSQWPAKAGTPDGTICHSLVIISVSDLNFIDVLGSGTLSRTIETYRARIEIGVTTRKSQSGLAESLRLRDQIIEALKLSGIDPGKIEEAGGQLDHGGWGGAKNISHELHVSHDDMQVLARAMVAVERIFVETKEPWFSGIHRRLNFNVPTPKYAKDDRANEKALSAAIANARAKASILAQESGLILGEVMFIREIRKELMPSLERPNETRNRYVSQSDDLDIDESADSLYDCGFDLMEYTPAKARVRDGRVHFHVRFATQRKTN